jgi:hypothetical protein
MLTRVVLGFGVSILKVIPIMEDAGTEPDSSGLSG